MHPLTVYDTVRHEQHERLRRSAVADARARRTGRADRVTTRPTDRPRRARRTTAVPAGSTAPAATSPVAR
jgi:hypothetical protein